MIERRLKAFILFYLWWALIEDSLIFLMAWVSPQLWFRVFHSTIPNPLEIALLRRSSGQWLAFALAQAITLWRFREHPVWLAVAAGIRFSDLFTDICYILSIPTINFIGYALLLPPALLNLIGVIILLRGFKQAQPSHSVDP